jgi:signal transduction histidine kinase
MRLKTTFISRNTFSALLTLLCFQVFGNSIDSSWDELLSMDLTDESDYDIINKEYYSYLYSYPDSALLLLEHYNNTGKSNQSSKYESRLYNMYGKYYYLQSEYPTSLEYHTKAIEIFEKNRDLKVLGSSYNGIGLIFLGQYDYQNSVLWQEKSLNIHEQLGDSASMVKSFFNLGLAFSEMSIYDSAFFYLKKSELLAQRVNSFRGIYLAKNRLADLSLKLGDIDGALEGYTKVINGDHDGELYELIFAYAGIAECYIAKNDGDSAVKYANLSYENALVLGAKWDAQRAAELQSIAYELQGDIKKSLQSFKTFKQLSDSIYNEKKDSEINNLLLVQKELENERMLAEKEVADQFAKNSFNLIIILILLVFSMLVIGLLALKNYNRATAFSRILGDQNKQILKHQEHIEQQNIKLTEINQSKDQLFTIISHDLRGPIGSIHQLYKMMEQENEDESEFDRKAINTFATQNIGKIRLLLENVLIWAKTQMQGISIDPTVINVKALLDDVYDIINLTATNKSIQLKLEVSESAEFYADLKQSKIILENVLINAIKFSNPESEIIVSAIENGDYMKITIQDFGVGMSAEKLKSLTDGKVTTQSTIGTMNEEGTGLGILLVKQLLINNDGNLIIESEPNFGTKVILQFPRFAK